MNTEHIKVLNLKCNGCANTIQSKLSEIKGVIDIQIDIEHSLVNIDHEESLDRKTIKDKLSEIGYPEA